MKIRKEFVAFFKLTGKYPIIEISTDLDLENHLDLVQSLYALALDGFEVNYKFNASLKKNTCIIYEN